MLIQDFECCQKYTNGVFFTKFGVESNEEPLIFKFKQLYHKNVHLVAYCAGSKPSLARFGIVTHTDLTLAQRYGAHYDKKSTL